MVIARTAVQDEQRQATRVTALGHEQPGVTDIDRHPLLTLDFDPPHHVRRHAGKIRP